jgi:hypothetical protein
MIEKINPPYHYVGISDRICYPTFMNIKPAKIEEKKVKGD